MMKHRSQYEEMAEQALRRHSSGASHPPGEGNTMNSIRIMILRALISGELQPTAEVFDLLNRLVVPAGDQPCEKCEPKS